jgi:hypothetical protein
LAERVKLVGFAEKEGGIGKGIIAVVLNEVAAVFSEGGVELVGQSKNPGGDFVGKSSGEVDEQFKEVIWG